MVKALNKHFVCLVEPENKNQATYGLVIGKMAFFSGRNSRSSTCWQLCSENSLRMFASLRKSLSTVSVRALPAEVGDFDADSADFKFRFVEEFFEEFAALFS